MYRLRTLSAILLLLALPVSGAAPLHAADKDPLVAFQLEYVSFPAGHPFTGTFTLNGDGSYRYVKEDMKDGAVIDFRGKFSEKDMRLYVDTLVDKHGFFSINPDAKSGPSKMDMDTATLTIKLREKNNTIGGYGATRIQEFSPVIRYVDEIVAAARKGAVREASAAFQDFSLMYVSRGSELPVETRFSIRTDGSYTWTRRHLNSVDGKGFAGRLSPREMELIADSFVNQFRFFSLPAEATHEMMIMDAATSSIEITHKGKTHMISAYAAESVPEYSAVIEYARKIVDRLRKKHPDAE